MSCARPLHSNFPTGEIGRPMDCEAIKRNAFADQGVVVISVNDGRLNDWERQFLKNIGMRIFGPSQGRQVR